MNLLIFDTQSLSLYEDEMAEIILYKKNPCPYCDRAIALLEEKGATYKIIDLTNNLDELDRIKNETGWKTVPIILINGKLVGGYTDLKTLDDNGELDPLLKT